VKYCMIVTEVVKKRKTRNQVLSLRKKKRKIVIKRRKRMSVSNGRIGLF